MKSLLLAFLAAPTALAAALPSLKVPTGDGVWIANYNAAGEQTSAWKLVASPTSADYGAHLARRSSDTATSPNPLAARELFPISFIGCTEANFTANDSDCAQKIMQNWADTAAYVEPNAVVISQCLTAQWYFCNYSTRSRAWRGEINDSWPRVDEKCGKGKGGWVYTKKYDKTYGRTKAGANECWYNVG